jgi:AMMECR1 domain-containing protein
MVNTSSRKFRCPECRTRRKDWGLFTQHLQDSGHALCGCGGYHFKHRPGSPFCERNPMSALLLAMRAGNCSDEELLEIEMDCAVFTPGRPLRVWPTARP